MSMKAGMTGMGLHQALSFSSFMMRVPQSEAVFWPGCALMNLDGGILEKTLEILRRKEPDIQLCTCCCGQPTVYLFPEKTEQRREALTALLKKQGVKRIYTGCPNCTVQLRELDGFEVYPLWTSLAEQIQKADIASNKGKYIWHDPCPTKRDMEQQNAVRALLKQADCDYIEPLHSGCSTICCGNFHMMHTLRPETSAQMKQRRLAEFSQERIIVSSCEGCLSSFRSGGRECLHLLELLFGKSKKRGWNNRFQTTFKQK